MDNNKLESKIDKIQISISRIDKHLEVYNAQLQIHIKRSDMLERKFEPVERHVHFINGLVKLAAAIATLTAIATYFLR